MIAGNVFWFVGEFSEVGSLVSCGVAEVYIVGWQ